MKISYSAFDTFNRCPLQYKFSYIDRVKVPQKPEFFFGGLIHEIVQYALTKDPIIPPVEELLKILKEKWQTDIFPSKQESDQYFDFGVDMIKKFHAGFKPGLRNIVATEKRFQIPLNEKHVLSGIIDRVDKLPIGSFEVIDYKTSKKLPSQIDVDKDKQLCIYNLAINSLWPDAKDIRLTLYFLKHDTQITTKRRPDEVESIKEEIIDTAERIEKETDFLPRDNALCDWCDYQKMCPLKKHKFAPDIKLEENTIDDIISDYLSAHDTIQKLEPKIQKHFDSQKIERFFHKNGTLTRGKTKNLSIRKP
jgi:putative RecB family exonuclease